MNQQRILDQSFLIKNFEIFLDILVHFRSSAETSGISTAQHTYLEGKSMETALQEAIRTTYRGIIDGAFNNVSTDAIHRALIDLGMGNCFSSWVIFTQEIRIIKANMGNINITKRVNRGRGINSASMAMSDK